jgi:Uma2 family endonuclease
MYQLSPQQPQLNTLPTMYDLPSEEEGESGLPDRFHPLQAVLLSETCRSPHYGSERLFTATDLNLYYDPHNTRLYKRPDWFMALGISPARLQQDLRWSYVIWQELSPPFLVVELLSPGTEAEDLGQTIRHIGQPPRKWEVYEQFLKIPYYVVYDRYENRFRAFHLHQDRYQALQLPKSRLWLGELGLGLGIWEGSYQDISGLWLRWYDANEQWVPTEAESLTQERARAEQERARAEQERARAEQSLEQGLERGKQEVALNMLQEGLAIDLVARATGFTIEQIQGLSAMG